MRCPANIANSIALGPALLTASISALLLSSSEVLRTAQDWEDVLVPAVLGEVRHDWVDHDQLGGQESHQDEWVDLATLGDQVVLLD